MSSLPFARTLRATLPAVAAAFLVVAASGCDTTEDTSLNVFVVDFDFDNRDYVISADSRVATFDARNARVRRGDLDDALRTAGDGALVVLYINVEQVQDVTGAPGNTTWAALPLTRAYEEFVLADDNGTTVEVPVVGYISSYEYSFDNGDLYFDVVSSAAADGFPGFEARDIFDFLIPQRADGTSSTVDLRLVTIPNELYFTDAQASARVDLRDYQAVKAAYGLPD